MAPWAVGLGGRAALETVVKLGLFLEAHPSGFAIRLDLGHKKKKKKAKHDSNVFSWSNYAGSIF